MPSFCTKTLLFLLMLSYTSAFLLDNQFLAPTPCTCSSDNIRCDYKQLSAVPVFKTSNYHTSTLLNVHLEHNLITTIPANAFLNIRTVNATNVILYLYSNKLSSIASNAFKGIENSTTYLDLHDNNLTSIPSALVQLSVLEILHIQGNPIHTINPYLFANIGHSLTSLNMDLNMFTDWPTEFQFLRRLKTLALNKIPFSHINEQSFNGFEATLTSLIIEDSKLENIPKAICHLTRLYNFGFRQNTYLIEPIVQHCILPLVQILDLPSNKLTEFPHILSQYPSLTTLYINKNQIHFVKAEDIPYASRITSLYIHENMLSRIPNVINKLEALSVLFISGNKIESIEDNDLTGLKSLTQLDLRGNPLSYISPHAFKQNTLITFLYLISTKLDQIPTAFMSLQNLHYLSGQPIECTCNMAYLKPWNVTSISWTTTCKSSTETIKDYILHTLPKCP